jgi:hypothetical protein
MIRPRPRRKWTQTVTGCIFPICQCPCTSGKWPDPESGLENHTSGSPVRSETRLPVVLDSLCRGTVRAAMGLIRRSLILKLMLSSSTNFERRMLPVKARQVQPGSPTRKNRSRSYILERESMIVTSSDAIITTTIKTKCVLNLAQNRVGKCNSSVLESEFIPS